MVVDPRNANRIYAATWQHHRNVAAYMGGGPKTALYRSEDGGETWSARNEGLPQPQRVWRVGIDPDTGHLLASVYQEALYESSDFGKNWKSAGLEGSAVNSFVFLPETRK